MSLFFRRTEKATPDFGFRPVGADRHAVNAIGSDPHHLARIGWRQSRLACQRVRIVTGKNCNRAGFDDPWRQAADFDNHLPRTHVVIGDQRFRLRKERGEMLGSEVREDTELAPELSIDDHPAGQAERT